MTPKGGKWWGTGHTEGGREQVRSLLLTVDGKSAPPGGDRSYKGKDLVLVKESTIWKFSVRALVRVQPDLIVERTELKALEDCELSILYYFMHCFPPSSTRWLAELPDGRIDAGELTHSAKMAVNKTTRWVAQYDPAMELSMLCYTPKVITGPRSASMIWDKERYHKYYLQQNRGQAFPAGDHMDYTVVVKMVPGETGDWAATRAAATKLKELFPINGDEE